MAVNPLFLKSATLTIDGIAVADEVSNVTFTPTSSAITFKGISGLTSQSSSVEVWAVSLTYIQDWTQANSLSMRLFNNANKSVTVVFRPSGGATGPSVTATVTLTPGAIGGAVDAAAESSVTLPVSGRPAISLT